MNIENILRQAEFFKGISNENCKALAKISIPKKVDKRKTLFLEDEKGHSMYLLIYGTVQLYKSTTEGKEIVIKVINPGEIFAETILFEQENYPVTAVALKECLVLMLPKYQIHCLLSIEEFRNDFISMLMKKQRHLTNRILYLTSHDVEERFFLFLLDQYGKKNEYHITMSKKDIAATIGTNPETLSRLLQQLREDKKISWKNKTLSLCGDFWENRTHER